MLQRWFAQLFGPNPKSTASGVVILTTAGIKAWHDPSTLSDPGTLAQIAAGIGLITAADGKAPGAGQ